MGNKPNKGVAKPAPLSKEDKENIVAELVGVHPKYFVYVGTQIKIDVYRMSMDGVNWSGFNIA